MDGGSIANYFSWLIILGENNVITCLVQPNCSWTKFSFTYLPITDFVQYKLTGGNIILVRHYVTEKLICFKVWKHT